MRHALEHFGVRIKNGAGYERHSHLKWNEIEEKWEYGRAGQSENQDVDFDHRERREHVDKVKSAQEEAEIRLGRLYQLSYLSRRNDTWP